MLRIVALAKQIPEFETMALGPDGRLTRVGLPLEMSAYDRRAVAQGVALARATGGTCTVVTLGPPSAEDVLLESLAFGADAGVLITDPAFAGSDTLATARALAAAIDRLGPFDLVLAGRNSVDAETGQVGPQVAELLDLPFATGVRELDLDGDERTVRVGCELDDEWTELTVGLPAVLSVAERLIDPAKIKDPAAWVDVDRSRLTRLDASDLGPGPWGEAGSPTWVGEVRTEPTTRLGEILDGDLESQVGRLVDLIRPVLANGSSSVPATEVVPAAIEGDGPVVAVLVEPGRQRVLRELLGAAAGLAAALGGRVVAIGPWLLSPAAVTADASAVLGTWGADGIVVLGAASGALVEEDVAVALAEWIDETRPAVVLGPGTVFGREVAGRVAARLGLGLTGDAVGLDLDGATLTAWKPAFGGALVAAVRSRSATQMATVRPGVLTPPAARPARDVAVTQVVVEPRGRIDLRARRRDDDLEVLATATRVVSVGRGVAPDAYPELDGLLAVLGAELAATRKVTDEGWLPHARQVGITGLSLAPDLAVVIGTRGSFNHMVGFRQAGLVVAINPDPSAPVFPAADYGVVASWQDVVPALVAALRVS